ncbi:ribonuclease R [Soehngenia longivitae]|uniref:Ribonuclease R n=1 Tax=Soehngenia longivitae TaxID=2562294 RepID=A0A4Z0D8G2_9FIRM|nr:ribonuclease R [Soehngenia longivitae]TFZ41204.1 ribonuclease R [Soehngenia longivitae]
MPIKERIIETMSSKEYKPLLKEELAFIFGINRKDEKDFFKILSSLEKEGLIVKNKEDRYILINNEHMAIGKIEANEKGYGFLIPNDKSKEDIFIPPENMDSAMHNDTVIVNITRKAGPNKKAEGEVIKVLERANTEIIGTFEDNGNFGFVVPDNPKIYYDVFIPKNAKNNAKNGQKVIVSVTKWPDYHKNPEGVIKEVLGYSYEKGIDILSIIKEYNLPTDFSDEAKKEAKRVAKIEPDDKDNRVDYRNLTVFTIDGKDAKDFDDAVSIEMLDKDTFLLGVHIADVSHYVRPKMQLDKEALLRGNSVYLLDRVIPMLPEELSNEICSLNPDTDRLTLSVMMNVDRSGKVIDHKIYKSIIKSKARLVYDDVSDLLEGVESDYPKELLAVKDELFTMSELMEILRNRREKRGSIDFDFPESYIELDENGKAIDVKRLDRRVANRMIEEFMLVTNETIAERFFWADTPFIYRIHEEPDPKKVEQFIKVLYNFGYRLKGKDLHPKEFQRITKEIKGKKEEALLSNLLLRTLQRAKYSAEYDVHFGLAAKYYTHFTSPIRRYADLQIHRIIKDYIDGTLSEKKEKKLRETLPEVAEHVSMTERLADEAERDVDDLKKAEYMSSKIGEEYVGLISNVTSFGMFVQLENTVEGLVHFSNMKDDYYLFDEENYQIIGEMTRKIYRIGDEVKIRVVGTDLVKKNIDFELVYDETVIQGVI